MNKTFKGVILGIIIGMILATASLTFAENIAKEISVSFMDIKLKINGKLIQTDTEPFIYNDRTFVPLRFVAEALGKDVNWDDKTNTVLIDDKKPIATSEKIQFSNILIKSSYGTTTVEGEAKNIDFVKHDMVLKVSFYDKDNKLIGTATGFLNDLEAGDTKTFSAMGSEDYTNYSTYKIQIDSLY